MKLIDVDNMEIRISGLDEVKAIPCDFIYNLINDPANAGSKSRVLSWLLREWEKDHAEGEDDSVGPTDAEKL